MGEVAPFTLGDLLDEASLGLTLLTGGEEALRRPVGGAHTIELPNPAPWLDRDWIMLTAGVQLSRDPGEQRRLIAELHDAGMAALGFSVGALHTSVPEMLVAEAERRGFPLFAVPVRTAFRDIITLVNRNLLSDEIRAFSRMTAMQRFLMDAIGEENPRATVVERLASMLNARVGLLSPAGEFAVASAQLPGPEILEALEDRQAISVTFSVGGLHGHAFPIGDPSTGEVPWLVIAGPEQRPLHPLAKAAGNATVPLLAAMTRLDRAQRLQEEAARRATLDALLEAETREEARVLAAQAAVWGLDVGRGVTIVAIDDPSGEWPAEQLLEAVRAARSELNRAMLATVHGGNVCALVPAPLSDTALEASLLSIAPALRAGVGRNVTEPLEVARSMSEAELALSAARQSSPSRIGRYDDLDLGTLLVKDLPLERLAPKIGEWLEPLRSNPRVFETLVAYFEHDLDVGRTAHALHLHPNSVRYRLSRAEEIIGGPVRSPTTLIALYVAISSDVASTDP